MSKFVLVEWLDEYPRQFSVVSVSLIEDGTRRQDGKKLVGNVLNILWKGIPCEAKVLDVGTEMKLLAKEAELAMAECQAEENETEAHSGEARKRKVPAANDTSSATSSKRQKRNIQEMEILNVLNEIEEHENSESDEHSEDWQSKYENVAARLAVAISERKKYKSKWRNRKAALKTLQEKYNDVIQKDLQVELVLGSGVYMKQSEISTLKLMSSTASILARNLFRALFSPEEMHHHSLEGKKCNANGNRYVPLPSVDIVRRNAIIGYALSTYGGDIGAQDENWTLPDKRKYAKTCRTMKREVKKSLSDFLREETRKVINDVL